MTTFYIGLPEETDQSLANLYRHALGSLKEEIEDSAVRINHFNLVTPYTRDDNYSVFIDYDLLNKQDLADQREAQEFSQELRVSALVPTEQNFSVMEGGGILEFRLPQGDGQDDSIRLVKEFIMRITQLGNITPLDCVYHDFSDQDGLSHPYFRLYYIV